MEKNSEDSFDSTEIGFLRFPWFDMFGKPLDEAHMENMHKQPGRGSFAASF